MFRLVSSDSKTHAPGISNGGVVPAFVSFSGLHYAKKRRIKAKRFKRQLWRQRDTFFGEFQPQQFGCGIEWTSMRVHVEHRKILPAKRLTAGCFSRMFAQGRIENVGTAPGSVPDLRIYLGVPRKRILFRFVPRHGTLNSNQRLHTHPLQRSPYSYRSSRHLSRLRHTPVAW